jgi:flagellar basal-body rod protein FlgF
MDRLLYIAMNGAKQIMHAQAVNSNNLANVSTTGFRADMTSALERPVEGAGYKTRIYSETVKSGIDFTEGAIITTGNDLDIAIRGKGFIAVQSRDGTEAYTRAGDLHINASGQLLNGSDNPVLGNGGPIAIPPFDKLEIGSDGTISIIPAGQELASLAVLDRIKLVNPEQDQLEKNSEGLLKMKGEGAQVVVADSSITLLSGALESSNVNSISAMVSMIEYSRQYEMQIKMMKEADENAAASMQVMRSG